MKDVATSSEFNRDHHLRMRSSSDGLDDLIDLGLFPSRKSPSAASRGKEMLSNTVISMQVRLLPIVRSCWTRFLVSNGARGAGF